MERAEIVKNSQRLRKRKRRARRVAGVLTAVSERAAGNKANCQGSRLIQNLQLVGSVTRSQELLDSCVHDR